MARSDPKRDLVKQMHSSCALLDELKKDLIDTVSLWRHSNRASPIIQAMAKIDEAIRLCEGVHRDALG
jgi:hypothetical protein